MATETMVSAEVVEQKPKKAKKQKRMLTIT